jgi:hypothetical protein
MLVPATKHPQNSKLPAAKQAFSRASRERIAVMKAA